MSKSAIDRKKYATFSNYNGVAKRTLCVYRQMIYKNKKLCGCVECIS